MSSKNSRFVVLWTSIIKPYVCFHIVERGFQSERPFSVGEEKGRRKEGSAAGGDGDKDERLLEVADGLRRGGRLRRRLLTKSAAEDGQLREGTTC